MKIWKKNAVVATVMLFVCVAVYLNWSYSQNGTENTLGDGNGEAEAASENGGGAAVESNADGDTDVSTVENSSGGEYFDTARLTREEARASSLSLLEEAAQSEKSTQEARDRAIAEIQTMAAATLVESQIESLIIAKSFDDCIAFISENSISVVVASPDGGLTESDVAKITDIVTDQSGLSAGQIKIIEVK